MGGEPLQASQVAGKDRHREGGCRVRANASGSYRRVAGQRDIEVSMDSVGDSNTGIAPGTDEQTIARDAPISHARALLIYLKHRGVLNVEEFRRTNARGL